MLGAKWSASAPIIEMLSLGAAFQALGYVYYWGFLSRARTGLLMLGESGGRIVMIVAIVVVAHFGVVAVAAASATGAFLIWFAGTFITGPRAGIGSIALAREALRPLALFTVAYGVTKAVRMLWLDAWNAPSILAFLVSAAIWLAVVGAAMAIPMVRRDVINLVAEVRTLRRVRSRGAQRPRVPQTA